MKKILILISLFLTSALAQANVSEKISAVERTEQACLDNDDNQSTVGINGCMLQAYEAYDKILNDEYKEITRELKTKTDDADLDKYNAETLKRLIASQRAWIKFRDTNSQLHGIEMLGGTGESMVVLGSLNSMTKSRILEITSLLSSGR